MSAFFASLVVVLLGPAFEDSMNRVRIPGPYEPTARATALLERSPAADLHADTLLWMRDVTRSSKTGHVDLPRLRSGRVGLQVFSVVTRLPHPMRMTGNGNRADAMKAHYRKAGLKALSAATPLERAGMRAKALRDMVGGSDGAMKLVLTRSDLAPDNDGAVRALLALEGLHGSASAETIDQLFAAGYRMLGPVHFTDTDMGGSAHGKATLKGGGGLSAGGVAALARMEALGIAVDLAHASPALFDDVIARSTRPVVVSHTGVRGTCDKPRNLSDAQLRKVAETGGVVGIGYWRYAVCGKGVKSIVKAINHAVGVVGPKHVALGSDFDGATAVPFDASGVPMLVEALLASGLSEADVEAIAGGNVRRVLGATLPE